MVADLRSGEMASSMPVGSPSSAPLVAATAVALAWAAAVAPATAPAPLAGRATSSQRRWRRAQHTSSARRQQLRDMAQSRATATMMSSSRVGASHHRPPR